MSSSSSPSGGELSVNITESWRIQVGALEVDDIASAGVVLRDGDLILAGSCGPSGSVPDGAFSSHIRSTGASGVGGGGDGGGGGGGGGGGDGGGDGFGGGSGGGRRRPERVSGVVLSDSRARTPSTADAENSPGKKKEHEAPSQVKEHPLVSVGSQPHICELDGNADPLPNKRSTTTGQYSLEWTEHGLPSPILPPVGLSPSRNDPAPTVAAAAASTTTGNSTDISEDTKHSTIFLGSSALPFPPTLATEEPTPEEAGGHEATAPVVPRPVKSDRQKQRQILVDVKEASHTPRVEMGTFAFVSNGCARGVQAATGVVDSAHVPFGACREQSAEVVTAAQPAEESGQTRWAADSDGVIAFSIPLSSATPFGNGEEEAEVEIAGNAAVTRDLAGSEAVRGRGGVGGSTAVKRDAIPDPTEEEGYAYDFESRKCVRFSDESLWSVHEVRASFERHELADLFYTVGELDRMLEEAEREERLESSLAQKGEVENDGRWVHLVGVTPSGIGVDVTGSIDDISIESQSFDGDDSDDHF